MARHEHDCEHCKPLGEHGIYDLYFCEQHGSPTVIARFGPDGDYISGMCFADEGVLLVAKTRAVEAGYVTPSV